MQKEFKEGGSWVKDGSLKAKTGGQKAQLMTSKDTKNEVSPICLNSNFNLCWGVRISKKIMHHISLMVSSLELFLTLNRFLVNNSIEIDDAFLSILAYEKQ